MGGARESVFTRHCPWSVALKDKRVGGWLSTFWLVKDIGWTLPGRQDPQLLDAIAVIAAEHNRIRTEEMEKVSSG
jgi:hypothetical protein